MRFRFPLRFAGGISGWEMRRMVVCGCTALICGVLASPATADDAADAPGPQPAPILLEPSSDPNPPVVPLDPDASQEPWDPQVIGDFTLVDQDGNTFTAEDLRGKPWVASFIFTRCAGACPLLAKKIYDLNKALADVDVRFVTITVDPEHDTIERMKAYADIYDARPDRWRFVTGDKEEIYRLIRHGFKVAAWEQFGTERLPGFEFAHSLRLIHVGPDGKVLGSYASGDDAEVLKLERVLAGKMDTPPENRPIPPAPEPPRKAPRPQNADPLSKLPPWAQRLPRTNAMLNGLATVLLLVGFSAIKAGRIRLHMRLMLTSFGVSVAFLACYLAYHFALHRYTGSHGKEFEGDGPLRTIYYAILISHVVLAMAVPVLAPITIYRGLNGQFDRHRRIARITFPIWLYVSVTGVIIYWMLYEM
jgi:protein SCO1/2/putative membrane protein